MTELSSYVLDILALLGGGRGSPLNNVTPNLLGVIFWGSLNLYLVLTRKGPRGRTDYLLMTGFILLFASELSQLIHSLLQARGSAPSLPVSAIWLPLENVLCIGGRFFLTAAFLQYLLLKSRLTINYLIASAVVVTMMFLGSGLPAWLSLAGRQEAVANMLGVQLLTYLPQIAVIAMYMFAIIKMSSSMRQIRWPVIISLGCLLLDAILSLIVDHAAGDLQPILNPIRGNLQLWTIPLIAYAALRMRHVEGKRLEHGIQASERLEALGQLSSGIAHDFNNNLQIILGYTELAKANVNNDRKLRLPLDRIEEAATSAGALVNQLLAFSRGQPPKFKPVDLNEIVTRLIPMLSRLLGADTRLVHNLDTNAHKILADPHMIEQIIINLVVNAKDAVVNGGTISIQTRSLTAFDDDQHTGEAGYARTQLLIADTGIGMDEKTVRRAFEPFFTTKPIGQGTGLGLSTVYSAVQKHNGKVFVKSEAGRYTRVYMDFPLTTETECIQSEPKVADKKPTASQGETILLAEDEPAIRDLARTLLQAEGYNVLIAQDGQHAINIMRTYKARVDLCIFDVTMPLLNGYDTYDRIASTNPSIPVLFITGNTSRVAHVRNHLPHMQKPFTKASLLTNMRQILEEAAITQA